MARRLVSIACSFVIAASVAVNAEGNKDEVAQEAPWKARVWVPEFSLGPAPFPDHTQMDWELYGSAYSRDDSIEVTKAEPHLKGAIWAKKRNTQYAKEWQAELTFRVGGGPQENHRFGDGFALWYITDRGLGGDALGGPVVWNGLGIFFDTYKNVHFKGKRHPFVYGYINNGEKNYNDITSADLHDKGCHIPFRNVDSTILDTTVAMVTYKAKVLSVVMRPAEADEWIDCFSLHNVDLPVGGYFGITAMTGELVDRHDMIQFQLFTNIPLQPESYSMDNDIRTMPDTWDEMRESGKIASGYTQEYPVDELEREWLEEEGRFDPSNYRDYYDYYGLIDDYYGEGIDPRDEKVTGKAPQKETRGKVKDPEEREKLEKEIKRQRKRKRLPLEVTLDERAEIERIFEGSEVLDDMIDAQEQQNKHIQKLEKHLEKEIKDLSDKISKAFSRIRHKESELNMRVVALGNKLHVELISPFHREIKTRGWGWFWPFIFMFIGLVGMTVFGFTKYKKFMKTHLL